VNGLLDVLRPQTPPEPKGARFVRGYASVGVEDHRPRMPDDEVSDEVRRRRQYARDWYAKRQKRRSSPIEIPTLAEYLGARPLAITRGVHRRR